MSVDDKLQLQAFCGALTGRLCRDGVERPRYQELSAALRPPLPC